jgi:hypothetical protein
MQSNTRQTEFFGAFAYEGDINICMEFIDVGSFDHILKLVGTVPEDVVANITVPVLRGLFCLCFVIDW